MEVPEDAPKLAKCMSCILSITALISSCVERTLHHIMYKDFIFEGEENNLQIPKTNPPLLDIEAVRNPLIVMVMILLEKIPLRECIDWYVQFL